MGDKIRVLIVDDSDLVRRLLEVGLGKDPDLEVVGSAPDPYAARDRIVELQPDVMTLDVEMPRMNGVEFLRRLIPQHPIPVVMVSSLTRRGQAITLEALAAGAVDFVAKPTTNEGRGLGEMMGELTAKLKVAASANVRAQLRRQPAPSAAAAAPAAQTALLGSPPAHIARQRVIAIGASTGGTEALREVLCTLPGGMPGIVVVQHMPPGFTERFAAHIDTECALDVKEAADGERVAPGSVLIAPGGRHLEICRSAGEFCVRHLDADRVSGHRPSVDVLMRSMATAAGASGVGALLTGMGHDGADGLLAMRRAGARTFAQDEASCVVFGMPKAAHERGAAEKLVQLDKIAHTLIGMLS